MYVLKRKEPKNKIILDGHTYTKATNWKSFKSVKDDIGDKTSKTAIAVNSKNGWAMYKRTRW